MLSKRDTDFDTKAVTTANTIDCKLMNEVQISHLGAAILTAAVTSA